MVVYNRSINKLVNKMELKHKKGEPKCVDVDIDRVIKIIKKSKNNRPESDINLIYDYFIRF